MENVRDFRTLQEKNCVYIEAKIREITEIVDGMRALTLNIDHAEKGEIIANITLAFRHLEDARTRFNVARYKYFPTEVTAQ